MYVCVCVCVYVYYYVKVVKAQLDKRAKLSKNNVYSCDAAHAALFGFEFIRAGDVAALVGQHLVAPTIPKFKVRGSIPMLTDSTLLLLRSSSHMDPHVC